MNYTTKTVSSETPVTQPESVLAILNVFDLRFQTRIKNGQLKIWGEDTFDVHNPDQGLQTEACLAALSFFLEDTLSITSIGFTGNRHEPDAYCWEVTDDMITYTRVDGTEDRIPVENRTAEIPDHIKSTYLPDAVD